MSCADWVQPGISLRLSPLPQQRTLQSSAATSGLSCPSASNICPFQALKRTAFSEGFSDEPSRQTEVLRQWMVMCCTTSELRSRRKFICTLPMSKSSCEGDRGVRARHNSRGGPCALLRSGGGHTCMSRTGPGMSMGKRGRCQVNLESFHRDTAGPLFFRTNWQVLKQ